MRAVDHIARALREAGCTHAFGIPGGEVLTMVDALRRTGIDFVLSKHENCAGFMAEGAYQRTGAPGVLVATLGPGVTNALTAIAHAWQDRVPMVVLTGCVDAVQALSYTHQVFDHRELLRPVVKASFTLADEGANVLAEKALAIARAQRPGPVHIDLPMSYAQSKQAPLACARHAVPTPSAPSGAAFETARSWVAQARRPLVLAGYDALLADAGASIWRFAEAHQAPVLTTYKAKGLFPEDHPLALGAAGLSPVADEVLVPFVQSSDLVVLVGYDPIEMRSGWRRVWDPDHQRVIELKAVDEVHLMHGATLSFCGNPGEGLASLAKVTTQEPADSPSHRLAPIREALAARLRPDETWGPSAVIDEARKCLPPDTVVTVDSGAHRILFSQLWRAPSPRSVLQSNGLCTMGCALPLALGAKLVGGSRPVVAFTGDAGLEMVLGELAIARDLALPVVVVVFIDGSLALIEKKQRAMQLPEAGVGFGKTDFSGLARALGGEAAIVRDRRTLAAALDAALATPRFTLVGCVIDARDYDGRI